MCRCAWVSRDQIYIDYHDNEWGVPVHDERLLFEMLILEGQQAGLSWLTILKRRSSYQAIFKNFDVLEIVKFNEKQILDIIKDKRIIRHELKVRSIISNAHAYLKLVEEHQSLDCFMWNYVNNKPIINNVNYPDHVIIKTDLSKQISDDLKKYGFKFVGPTIIYAYMQAIGLVNDHDINCYLKRGCNL